MINGLAPAGGCAVLVINKTPIVKITAMIDTGKVSPKN